MNQRIVLTLILIVSPAFGQESLTPRELLGIRKLSGVQLAPDGQRIAFLREYADTGVNRYRRDLFAVRTSGGDETLLAHDATATQWSPDGRKVAFLRGDPGKRSLRIVEPEGGGERLVRGLPSSVTQFAWSPDSRSSAVSATKATPSIISVTTGSSRRKWLRKWMDEPPTSQGTDSTWRDHDRAATDARRRSDWRSAREHARAVDSLIGGHPRVVVSIARMSAKLGDTASVQHELSRVADMGQHLAIAADSDLVALASTLAPIQKRFDANVLPKGAVKYDARIRDRDFIAEGVAHDATRRRLLVSSIRHNHVVEFTATDSVRTAIDLTNDGAWSGIALAVDAPRNALWVTSMYYAHSIRRTASDSGRSAVLLYDLSTDKLRRRWELPIGGEPGDVCLAPDGTLYVSDGRKGTMYAISENVDSAKTLMRPGVLVSPQGCAVDPLGDRLFVADYVLGIAGVSLKDGTVKWLRRPPASALNGIDGMILHGDDLIGVQNGTTPNRLVVAELDAERSLISRVRVLAQDTVQIREPTHVTVAGDTVFFVANGGFGAYETDGRLRAGAIERSPRVGRIALRGPLSDRRVDTLATQRSLLAADSALARDMARRGNKALLEGAAPEAAILLPEQPIAPARISEGLLALRYGSRTIYRHEPGHAVAGADGQFGCTLGLSRYAPDSSKPPIAGLYATCWRRTHGRWEIIAHYRNEGESSVPTRWTGPAPQSPTRFFAGLPDEWSRDAKAADSAFARMGFVGDSPAHAFAAYVAGDGIVMTPDKIYQGTEGMRELFTGFPKDRVLLWDPHPEYGWASGGLAFTVGHSANAARARDSSTDRLTKYFTIWRQDADGRWRFIFDAGSPRQ